MKSGDRQFGGTGVLKAQVGLFVALYLAAIVAQAQGSFTRTRELKVDPGTFTAAQQLVAPTLPTDIPAGSAGCLVVGQHLDERGATSKPRVMQGAFTKGVPAETQKAFIAQALDASTRWRFRFDPPTKVPAAVKRDVESATSPEWAFHRVVVGFAAAVPAAEPTAVFDADKQDSRVSAQCQLEPLADWGERNAVSVEVAKLRTGDSVLNAKRSAYQPYWVGIADMQSPRYPVQAVKTGLGACVILGFMIGVDGVPSGFRVMDTRTVAPPPVRKMFEDAALGAASTWRYAPGPDNLQRLPEFRQTPVQFSIGRNTSRGDCEALDLSATT